MNAVIENMDEGISVCDKDGNLVFMNDTYAHRMNHIKLSYPIPYEEWAQYMEIYEENGQSQIKIEDFPLMRVLRGEEVKQQVIVVKPPGKPIQYISVNGKEIKSKHGEKIGALVVLHDITEQRQAEEKIKHMAYHDKLTGLPNLRFFKDKLDYFLVEGTKSQANDLFAIMFIDLDGFKNVNDDYGHDIGDLLLIEVSKRITSCLSENDVASRIGGDEFTVMLPKINSEEDATTIAKNIIDIVGSPYNLQGNEIHVTTSIGVAYSTYNRINRRAIIKNADIAMYSAKQKGKNQCCVFHE